MRKSVIWAIFVIFSLTGIVYILNKYFQLFNSELIIEIGVFIGILVAVAAILSALVDISTLYQNFEDARNRLILTKKFSMGPYDKSTINRSTKYYVKPKCSNLDPANEVEPRHALMATSSDLFEKIDYFINKDDSKKFLLVLADSGTGKTSFILNYFAANEKLPKKKRKNLVIVPLGIPDADYRINSISDKDEKIILIDAFDEDTKAIEDHKERLQELMSLCCYFRKIIMTCRTQFFPSENEIPTTPGVAKFGPRSTGESQNYEFWKIYLSPFDDIEIEKFLQRRYNFFKRKERERAKKLITKIPLLAVRPMLLSHIPDLITRNIEINYSYELYADMINSWLDREVALHEKTKLKKFSNRLAVEIFLDRQTRKMERISSEELNSLVKNWEIDLPKWKLTGRSLLNRDAEGNLKFAHRSIMEYIFVEELIKGNPRCFGISLTDQMKKFLIEILSSFYQSSYFALMYRIVKDKDLLVMTPDGKKLEKYISSSELFGKEIDEAKEFIDYLSTKRSRSLKINGRNILIFEDYPSVMNNELQKKIQIRRIQSHSQNIRKSKIQIYSSKEVQGRYSNLINFDIYSSDEEKKFDLLSKRFIQENSRENFYLFIEINKYFANMKLLVLPSSLNVFVLMLEKENFSDLREHIKEKYN